MPKYIIPFRGYCPAKDKGEVKCKAKSDVELCINGKPVFFCQGYIDRMTDELLDTCRKCKRNTINADKYIGKLLFDETMKINNHLTKL